MKKPISLLLSLLFAFAPTLGFAQKGKVAQTLKSPLPPGAVFSTAKLQQQLALVFKTAWSRPVIIKKWLLPAAFYAQKNIKAPLEVKVFQRTAEANPNQEVDLRKLTLEQADSFEIIQHFKAAPAKEQVGLFLNIFPYLNISRNVTVTETDRLTALKYYRTELLTALKHPSSTANAWGRNMAAVSNLGIYGTESDGLLILKTAAATPGEFTVYTDIISARALLGIENYKNLEELALLRAPNGELPAHWQGIIQYAQEAGLPAKFPPVKQNARVAPMTQDIQTNLEKWNPLNLYHANISAEATSNWLALRKTAEANIIPDASRTAAAQSAEQNTSPAAAEVRAPLSVPAERHHFFKDPKGREGPLAAFCQSQGLDYTGKTLEEVITQINSTPALRSSFISMIKNNDSDLVYKWIKGLGESDYQTLKSVYPAENNLGEFSPRLGEDILNLLSSVYAPPHAAQINGLMNNRYFFISHFRGERIYLGTEFNSTEIQPLSQHITEFNRANGIERTDFLSTFSPSAGQSTAVNTNPNVEIDPNRIFTFNNGSELTFDELPAFLQKNPNAVLKSSRYRQSKNVTYTNTKTGETVTKPGVTKLRQESLDEELRALENLLRGDNTRDILLLDGQTAEENFRFMFERMQTITPVLKTHLRQILGKEPFTLSYRFGTHEIEGIGNLVPLANMHMHLEAYIPALKFTYNISIPMCASEQTKADILSKFQEWEAKGKPKGSPIEYYGTSLWIKLSPKKLRRLLPGETTPMGPEPAAEYPEMYEGDFALGFAF